MFKSGCALPYRVVIKQLSNQPIAVKEFLLTLIENNELFPIERYKNKTIILTQHRIQLNRQQAEDETEVDFRTGFDRFRCW